jgi:hypothetical protein
LSRLKIVVVDANGPKKTTFVFIFFISLLFLLLGKTGVEKIKKTQSTTQ